MPPTQPLTLSLLGRILKRTFLAWKDNAFLYGAAVAYFALFSIAPLLLVALAGTTAIYGAEAASGELEQHLTEFFGQNGAEVLQAMITSAQKSRGNSALAVIVGMVILLFGASSIFKQLKNTLNRMWGVTQPRRKGIVGALFNRAIAILMVIIVAAMLLASLIISTVISRMALLFSNVMPVPRQLLHLADIGVSFLLLAILFGLIFKLLPDVRVGWKSVSLGAIVTSILFGIGKYVFGFYIAHGGMSSGYGAAGSLVGLLAWVYYSALIFFFGAEFTHIYSEMRHLPMESFDRGEVSHPEEDESLPGNESP